MVESKLDRIILSDTEESMYTFTTYNGELNGIQIAKRNYEFNILWNVFYRFESDPQGNIFYHSFPRYLISI